MRPFEPGAPIADAPTDAEGLLLLALVTSQPKSLTRALYRSLSGGPAY